MKWKISVSVALFLLCSITASAQGGAVLVAGGVAGLGKVLVGVGGAALVVNEFAMPLSPAQRMQAQRAEYLADEHHAVVKHGPAANAAYQETANTEAANVTKYNCTDGRDRTVNWKTNALRVEQDGHPITAFHYKDRYSLQRALLRDGCIEKPTRPVGHDDTWQMPGAIPRSTGAQKSGTPTAEQIR